MTNAADLVLQTSPMLKVQWPSHGHNLAAHGVSLTGNKLSLCELYRLMQNADYSLALKVAR